MFFPICNNDVGHNREFHCIWERTLSDRKTTVAELIELYLEEKGMSQKQLAIEIGISLSRVNDYIAGRSEPTLKIARLLCRILNIPPVAMLGF